jgi:glycosyltransferase involved in cell wall biosynthesis
MLSVAGDGVSFGIVVMCRNHERYVAACLRSIMAADQPCELVFVDNGSRDSSVAVARATLAECPAHITWTVMPLQPEQPLCRALNIGHAELRTEIIKAISADDTLGPNFFETMRQLVRTSPPDVGLWLAGSVVIDESDRVLRQTYGPTPFGTPDDGAPVYLDERHVIENQLAPPYTVISFFYRRRTYVAVGGYDERFRYEDKPFLFNVIKGGWRVSVHPFNNTNYRVHSQGISADSTWMAEARLPITFDQALRSEWRNKPLAFSRLVRTARVVAMNRWRKWRAAG